MEPFPVHFLFLRYQLTFSSVCTPVEPINTMVLGKTLISLLVRGNFLSTSIPRWVEALLPHGKQQQDTETHEEGETTVGFCGSLDPRGTLTVMVLQQISDRSLIDTTLVPSQEMILRHMSCQPFAVITIHT